jgi:hypothetical protein
MLDHGPSQGALLASLKRSDLQSAVKNHVIEGATWWRSLDAPESSALC